MLVSWLINVCGGICVFLPLVKTDIIDMKAKLCKLLCDVDDCSSQFFFPLLSRHANFDLSCEKTKIYVDNCITRKDKPTDSKDPKDAEKTKLLVAPHGDTSYYVINVEKDEVNKYAKKPIGGSVMTAMTYASKLDLVIYGMLNPNNMYATTLGEPSVDRLLVGILTYGLAVDEESQDVFISAFNFHLQSEVGRVTVSSKQYRCIIKINHEMPWSIALDSKRKIIYVALKKYIMSTTYEGKKLEQFSTSGTTALAFNQYDQVLYYNIASELFATDVARNKSTSLAKLPFKPYAFALDDKLYMSSNWERRMYYYHFKTRNLRKMPEIHRKRTGALICLIH